jgi:hypothetical protein
MQWCIASLQAKGFTLPISRHTTNDDGSRVHKSAYLNLRREIRQHMNEFGGDALKLCTPPRKALDWQPTEEMQQRIPERPFMDEDQTGMDLIELEKSSAFVHNEEAFLNSEA